MTRNIMEGFDPYGVNGIENIPGLPWAITGVGGDVVNTTPRNGGLCYKPQSSRILRKAIPAPSGYAVFGGAHRLQNADDPAGFGFQNGSGDRMTISFQDGTGRLIVNSTNMTAVTGAVTYSTGTWYYLELVLYNDGTIEGWINNTKVIDASDPAFGLPTEAFVGPQAGSGLTGNNPTLFDDFYQYNDEARKGDHAIIIMGPNADTANADWALASGTDGFDMINNIPVDLAKYIETSTVNDISDFDVSAPPSDIVSVDAVGVFWSGLKPDASANAVRSRVISSGVAGSATERNLSESIDSYLDIYPTNPNGGVAWVPGDLPGLEIGFEKTV